MTLDEFLPRLDSIRLRGYGRWSARCPGHMDKSPSLSVSEGAKGVLLKCWAGCTVEEICRSLGIEQRELFFDALDSNPARRREAAQQRDRQKQERECHDRQQGALIDVLREADYFVRSRRMFDITGWSHKQLNAELDALADAYHLLENEDLYGCTR